MPELSHFPPLAFTRPASLVRHARGTLGLACLLSLFGCSLPPLEGRSVSHALSAEESAQTRLGRAVEPELQAHPGTTGIHPLEDPHDAFAARALLARAAERTLDVQYYIWHNDITGTMLLGELLTAAERGVRVRMLIDDIGTSGLDTELAAMAAHANIEVRLFNPMTIRKPKMLSYVISPMRANRRMHNKSFTVDNQATIIGGRNVGDEYFGATDGKLFADLDVLAIGPVTKDVSTQFDAYWTSASAYQAQDLLPAPQSGDLEQLKSKATELMQSPRATEFSQSITQSPFVARLMDRTLPMQWVQVKMVTDDPAKGLGKAPREHLLFPQLEKALGKIDTSVDLVSAYFVPGKAGVDAFGQLADAGVKVRVLTNAIEATDVPAVHAGYAKRRKDLLERGVTLYEMRSLVPSYAGQHEKRFFQRFGSSGASLHAKTFAVDGKRLFVGSFNFDPRSAHLNTELGFLIDSPELAQQLIRVFDKEVPRVSYRVELGKDGDLQWVSGMGANATVYTTEPHTTWWSRGMVRFLGWLPIEWLL
ncbi:phospholipase D family protein [Diaphorobacter caeni]|uniref:phospholipase D family protein n=1 Tax=Diaphorobacter caeni TaxID=2784387 RepID=UPI00188DEC3E|nr:phospholipase D family protein [Diaphorobacter caeni]MBF5006106.1 phospholipase D family protein [Diaphorobacter caeni]